MTLPPHEPATRPDHEPAARPDAEPPVDGPQRLPPERPHPLTPLVKGWIGLVAIAIFVGRDAIEHPSQYRHGPRWWMIAIVGGVLLLQFAWGYFVWRTTRFVVDDTELRIERKFIDHSSERIPFTKIQAVEVEQPFAARLLNLALVRIDVGSGRGKAIEFLSRSQAYAMRDYLIARAHGEQISVRDSAGLPQADAFNDRAATDKVIVRALPKNLVLAAVTSHQFLLAGLVPLLVIAFIMGFTHAPVSVVIPSALPFVFGLVGIISHHVLRQWNYTLTETRRGLRVSRGLTSLTSESIPVDRIQGIMVRQSLLWRPLGLYRVQMDVLGKMFSGGDAGDVATGSLLVPAGTRDDVRAALRAIWPDADVEALPWVHVSPRGRWLCWFTWSTQQWAIDSVLAATRGGVLENKVQLVPHARVQSVRLQQGPLERWVGVARVEMQISAGLVSGTRSLLDPAVARSLALGELDRCRTARAARAVPPSPPGAAASDHPNPPESSPGLIPDHLYGS